MYGALLAISSFILSKTYCESFVKWNYSYVFIQWENVLKMYAVKLYEYFFSKGLKNILYYHTYYEHYAKFMGGHAQNWSVGTWKSLHIVTSRDKRWTQM